MSLGKYITYLESMLNTGLLKNPRTAYQTSLQPALYTPSNAQEAFLNNRKTTLGVISFFPP